MNCRNTCEQPRMDDQPLTLQAFLSHVETQVQQQLTGLNTVALWPDIRDRIQLPAMFLELAEIEPGREPGTGQVALVCRLEAYVIVAAETTGPHQQAAQLATQLAVLLHGQYWDLESVDVAEFVQAGPDWTKPELDSYTVWKVEWTQEVRLAQEQWPWPDAAPTFLEAELNPKQVDIDVLRHEQ